MLALHGAGFRSFCQSGSRQTPRVENTPKVPRFFLCVYFKEQGTKVKSENLKKSRKPQKKQKMKKIFFILLVLFTGSSFVAEASNETSCMNSSVEGRRWTVTITVNMIYEYYENEIRTIFVGSVNKGTTTERVSVYAETRDEAERMAKVQCAGMCSTSGNYQGTANYKGKKCHVWLVRQIESARAE